MKKLIIVSLALGILPVLAFAQQQETVTITTYYPSPYGVYSMMRLYPRDDIDPAANCSSEGEMFYKDADNKIYYCDGSQWRVLLGEPDIVTIGAPSAGSRCNEHCPGGLGPGWACLEARAYGGSSCDWCIPGAGFSPQCCADRNYPNCQIAECRCVHP